MTRPGRRPSGPPYLHSVYYKELLQQWKKDEDSIQDQLNEIEGDVKYVRKKLDDLTEKVSAKKEVIVEG